MINICQSNILRSNQLIRNYFSNNSKENSENAFLIVRTSNRSEIMKLSMKCFQIVWDVLHPIRWLDTQKNVHPNKRNQSVKTNYCCNCIRHINAVCKINGYNGEYKKKFYSVSLTNEDSFWLTVSGGRLFLTPSPHSSSSDALRFRLNF